ncbi:MAG TPA: trigger factor [Patescibacteria group bacterium]|nr:trigger factor [Patescibacteria group bacterium]
MNVKREDISKNEVKLTITVTNEEMQPFLLTAATHISEGMEIDGFRKGKATLDAVINQVGEMKVLEEALEPAVSLYYVQAADKEDLNGVGMPKIDIEKMVPGNDLVFTAVIALMPAITKLGDYKKLSIKSAGKKVDEKEVEKAAAEIARMQTKEVRAEKGHVVGDDELAVIDLNLKKDNVPLEGGQAQGFKVFMAQDTVVPGIKEGVRGMKEGEEKTFKVTFPEDHYQKNLAGNEVDAEVKVNEVFTLDRPKIDDEFAKSIGLTSVDELKKKLRENLEKEQIEEEKNRQEREMLELLSNETKFEDIPSALVNDELDKMVHELEHSVERQGGKFVDYLQQIDKTPQQLRESWKDQAELRVKVALVLREVAKVEEIEATDDDVTEEITKQASFYQDNEAQKEQVETAQYREYMKHRMRNQKVIAFLRDKMVKQG